MKRVFSLALIFVLLLAISCNDKTKEKEQKLTIKEQVSREISSEDGGKIESSDGNISIEIPADALDSNTEITMKIYDASDFPSADDEKIVSKIVEFEPSGTIFKKPVIISMNTNEAFENKIVAAAVLKKAEKKWSYSEHGTYAVLDKNEAGDPIITSAAGDPIGLNAAGDPVMINTAGEEVMFSAAGDPIMLTAKGTSITSSAAGDPIMTSAAGDPIMMTTGHFTAYTFIALEPEEPDNDEKTPDEDEITGESHQDEDNETDPVSDDDPNDQPAKECTPGESRKCDYHGTPGTENKGPCKAAVQLCREDGSWGECTGEVLPANETGEELCSDGIDNDCNGVIDDGTDLDGDGHGACSDCCETNQQCPAPSEAWDDSIATHICKYEEITYSCDSDIAESSTDPFDYAKAIGICNTTTEDSNEWGLISASITAPDGSLQVHDQSSGLLSKLGNLIKPKAGGLMLGLSSGQVTDPFTEMKNGSQSGAPSDWLEANNGSFPSAPACGGTSGTSGNVNDAVMFEMRIRVPKTARSFSFDIYFLTKEYPTYICSNYNDFFIELLDSAYTSDDPAFQNPADKNLAMDAAGNPIGINIAASGLFTQCSPNHSYTATETSCTGTEELEGTGFEENGGTGWLTTRGNVVGGEIITLRLAIWDLGDHLLDSLVLIDNFQWHDTVFSTGTGQE